MDKKITLIILLSSGAIPICAATENVKDAEIRHKCVTGAAAAKLMSGLYTTQGIGEQRYNTIQKELQKEVDPKLNVCYRKSSKEIVILDSNERHVSNIQYVLARLYLSHDIRDLSYKKTLPSGESVLTFATKKPDPRRKRALDKRRREEREDEREVKQRQEKLREQTLRNNNWTF